MLSLNREYKFPVLYTICKDFVVSQIYTNRFWKVFWLLWLLLRNKIQGFSPWMCECVILLFINSTLLTIAANKCSNRTYKFRVKYVVLFLVFKLLIITIILLEWRTLGTYGKRIAKINYTSSFFTFIVAQAKIH